LDYTCRKRNLKTDHFGNNANIASNTMTRLNKGEKVSLMVLMKICAYLGCNIGDICDVIPDESAMKGEE
jgi:DNA-binding Xre family transcriptional regulator